MGRSEYASQRRRKLNGSFQGSLSIVLSGKAGSTVAWQEGWWTWHPQQIAMGDARAHQFPLSPHRVPPRGTPSHPALFQTATSLPCVLSASFLTGSTSRRRTRCGLGHGGSASSGPEQPPSSSPSPSWGTPSASQVCGPPPSQLEGIGAGTAQDSTLALGLASLCMCVVGDTRAEEELPVLKL